MLILTILYSFLINLGIFLGYLSFGYGLGDLYGFIGNIIFIIIILLLIFISRLTVIKRKSHQLMFSVILFLYICFTILSLTVLRGSEQPWDGNLFINNSPVEEQSEKLEKFENL
jgi:uncharacterized membrane protein YhaH (DUF805 family)